MKAILASLLIISSAAAPAKPVPSFSIKGTDGKTYSPQSFLAKPTLILFLSNGCPHNPHSIPVFNRLKKELAGKMQIVAFVNSSPAEAKTYAKTLKATFPFLADPKAKTMLAFGAAHSLDLAYVTDAKKPIFSGVTDGFDRPTLTSILQAMRSSGRAIPQINLSFVPTENQSGCGI